MGRVSLPSEIVIWSNLAGDCEQPARAGAGLRLAPNTYVNTWEADTTKVLSNTEMSDLAAAVGTGLLTDEMSEEEIEAAVAKLRYGKVVVLADADIDGSHIECLLLGHFFRHLRPLVERGHIYIGMPPLYRVTERGKHLYLKDEAALADFFRKRSGKIATGGSKALSALAGSAGRVVRVLEQTARAFGFVPGDVSHAIFATDLVTEQGDLFPFAEALMGRREQDGCENVTGEEVSDGVVVISGLEPGGRYFTTVVNQTFYEAAVQAREGVAELIGQKEVAELLKDGGLVIGDQDCGHLLEAAKALEAEARKGISITRLKGLGEMDAEELGETTLDRNTRRLIKVTVSDFDQTGNFVGSMLSQSTVEARRELVRSVELDQEMVDA